MPETVYGDIAGFTAYWAARGKTDLPATWDETTINAALLVASEWIDRAFINQFMGLKVDGRDQIREWPRNGVQDIYGYYIPSDVPPREIINATYEAAFRELTTPGIFFTDYKPGKYKSATVYGAVSVQYAVGDAYSFQTQMPQIAAILSPLLSGNRHSFSGLSGGTARA